jgi:hypothetical protein
MRACEVLYSAPTFLAFYRYDGTNIPVTGDIIVAATRITVVLGMHTDGNFYVIDANGTTAPCLDTTANIIVDRFSLHGTNKFRIVAAKLVPTGNPLLIGQQAWIRASVML